MLNFYWLLNCPITNVCNLAVWTWNSQLSHKEGLLTTNHIRVFCNWHNYHINIRLILCSSHRGLKWKANWFDPSWINATIFIENNAWGRGDMEFLFDCSTRYLMSERSANSVSYEWAQRTSETSPLNMTREIPYLVATMYYFVYDINILPTTKSRLNSRFI